jgi:hypothetical protein
LFTIYFILVTFWIFRPPIWGDFGRIFALVPSIHQGTRKRHSSELIETFSKWSNNPRKLEITVFRHIWKISPLTSSRFTFREFCLFLVNIFALVPSIHQGTRKRHSSELIETFSKWSNNPRKLEITVSRHIWKIFPLTSSRFTFRRFWPKKLPILRKNLVRSRRGKFFWKTFF